MAKDCVEMFEINKRYIHGATLSRNTSNKDDTELSKLVQKSVLFKDYNGEDLEVKNSWNE